MSTASQIERACAAAAAGAMINPGGPAAGADNRATCLATAEAVATATVKTARQAAATARATAAAAAALRAELEREPARGSRSPDGRRR